MIEVTTLADAGAGSLREALLATGPRIVVFRVAGTIVLRDRVRINSPFVTIAGQSAPGAGIQLRGAGLAVNADDVIIRGLRIRPGDAAEGPAPIVRDGLEVWKSNVIIDHCSLSWAVDETASTWFNTANDITFQWNIMSEGLNESTHPQGRHSKGLLIGDGAKRISIHHNLFAHQEERSPHQKGGTDVEIINNYIYNWGGFATHYATCYEDYDDRTAVLCNVIANFYKPGVSSSTSRLPVFVNTSTCPIASGSKLYLKGNVGPGRSSNAGDEYAISNVPMAFRATSAAATPSAIVTETAEAAAERVLRCAGMTSPQRDAIDERVVAEARTGMGRIIDSQDQVGGWPTIASATPPVDSDHDGIADAWETARGLNPNDASDGKSTSPTGYTWVEDYLNALLINPCSEAAPVPSTIDAGAPASDGGSGGATDSRPPTPAAGSGGQGGIREGEGGGAGEAGGASGEQQPPDVENTEASCQCRLTRTSQGSRATPWLTLVVALCALAVRRLRS